VGYWMIAWRLGNDIEKALQMMLDWAQQVIPDSSAGERTSARSFPAYVHSKSTHAAAKGKETKEEEQGMKKT